MVPLSERQLVAHLLRRAGFGATPAELDTATAAGFDATLERVLNYESIPTAELDASLSAANYDLTRLDGLQRWWLHRMCFSPRPLEEKLTLFWHGHFATQAAKVEKPPYMLLQNQLFRRMAMGSFGELVLEVTRDPAMLVFLDGKDNGRRRPNENYARELFELFTLGIGNYTETDIREAARALTGWTIRNDRFYDNVTNHDSGTKTILGQTGRWTGTDVCRLAVAHPACAPFIARKLIRFFVVDAPADAFVQRVASAFRASGMSIRAALEAIFRSSEFRQDAAVRGLIKSPAEHVVGMVKHLDIKVLAPDFINVLRQMQQQLFNPPGVEGWDGGPTWLSSTTFLHRTNFASRLCSGNDPARQPWIRPLDIVAQNNLTTNRAVVDYFADRLLDGDVAPEARGHLVAWLDAGTSSQRLRRLRGAIHLLLSTTSYQLN